MLDAQAIQALKVAPVFSALDAASLKSLAARCRTKAFAKGQMIFAPCQAAEAFFVVLAGRVKVFMLSPRGEEQILHLYGPGATFGEAAMLAGIDYPAHAEPVEDSRLLVVTRAVLREAMAASPDLAMGMLAGLSSKLREFNRLIEDLSLKEVPARLAGALLKMRQVANADTFRLPATKRELAAQIGTVAETLSRALGKLKSEGLIQVKGSEVTLLDVTALKEVAQSG